MNATVNLTSNRNITATRPAPSPARVERGRIANGFGGVGGTANATAYADNDGPDNDASLLRSVGGSAGAGFGSGFSGSDGGPAVSNATAITSVVTPTVTASSTGGMGGSGAAGAGFRTRWFRHRDHQRQRTHRRAGLPHRRPTGAIAYVGITGNSLSVGQPGGNTNNSALKLSGTGSIYINGINGTGSLSFAAGSVDLQLVPFSGISSNPRWSSAADRSWTLTTTTSS